MAELPSVQHQPPGLEPSLTKANPMLAVSASRSDIRFDTVLSEEGVGSSTPEPTLIVEAPLRRPPVIGG